MIISEEIRRGLAKIDLVFLLTHTPNKYVIRVIVIPKIGFAVISINIVYFFLSLRYMTNVTVYAVTIKVTTDAIIQIRINLKNTLLRIS